MNLSTLLGFNQSPAAVGSVSSDGAGAAASTAPLADTSKMKTGQTIQGEVVAVKGNEIVLELDNGSQLSARLDKNMPIGIGQTVTFEVKSNAGNRLALSPLYENMGHDPNVLKALTAAGMASTSDNIKMVTVLMREGLPINKGLLHEFGRQTVMNPTADPVTLAQMNRLQIPVTPENIAQFEAYKNYEHQISAGVMEIADGLADTFTGLIKSGDADGAANLFKQVVALFTESQLAGEPAAGEGGQNAAVLGEVGEKAASGQPLNVHGGNEALSAAVGKPSVEQGASGELLSALIKAGAGAFPETGVGQTAILPAVLPGIGADAAGELLSSLRAEGSVAPSETILSAAMDAESRGILDMAPEHRQQLAGILREAGFSEQLTTRVNDGTISSRELLPELAREINRLLPNMTSDKLTAVFEDKSFQGLLKNEIGRQWLLQPEAVAEDHQVEELYRRLNNQTARLTDALAQTVRADAPIAQSVNNLANNINFINQLNQMYTYVQLPLKMNGEHTHGDLYVYTNKKHLAKQDGNVSALLHLDMEHLGPVDVYVAMQNRDVSTKFYLSDDRVIDLVAGHINILTRQLQKRGYSMNCEFIPKAADKNPVEEMFEENKNLSVIGSYSFDARA